MHPLSEAVIVYVTVSVVSPLLIIVSRILPVPDKVNPVRLPEEGEAVQVKVAPGIREVN